MRPAENELARCRPFIHVKYQSTTWLDAVADVIAACVSE